jgi:subtilisin-like proprotein convertase family protein
MRSAGRREKEVEGRRGGSKKKWISLRQCDENSLNGNWSLKVEHLSAKQFPKYSVHFHVVWKRE